MTNFLFSPINTLKRSLRSACSPMEDKQEELEDGVAVIPSSQEEGNESSPDPIEAMISADESRRPAKTSTVSPPLEELLTTATGNKDDELVVEESIVVSSPARRPRKKRRNELDNLVTWDTMLNADAGNEETGIMETGESTRQQRRRLRFQDVNAAAAAVLPVTPSPLKTRRVSRRGSSTYETSTGTDEVMVMEDPLPRKRAPRSAAALTSTHETLEVDNVKVPGRKRPRKAATKEAPQPQRRMPTRKVSKALPRQDSFVYYDDYDDDDFDENPSDLFADKKRAAVKKAPKNKQPLEETVSSDEEELDDESDDSLSGEEMLKRKNSELWHSGTWSDEEKLIFLHAARICGRGKWGEIGERFIKTR